MHRPVSLSADEDGMDEASGLALNARDLQFGQGGLLHAQVT